MVIIVLPTNVNILFTFYALKVLCDCLVINFSRLI
jgi:hypothetical protein